ncbi:MAG: hypothetical protein ATN32_04575 [Candidatus Epulonipiscium fishelsonii]|nr:MAG: hypothetical protein ATN32_04575 [Epulopiscium sp. AS2M-Bin002]
MKKQIVNYITKIWPNFPTWWWFVRNRGEIFCLITPKSLSAKITYLNLYKRSPYASICADKYNVRKYLKNTGGGVRRILSGFTRYMG